MHNNILLSPLEDVEIDKEPSFQDIFLNFICRIEGWKTKCKNLHWAAPKKNIHVYLDEFHDILDDYQDVLAEGVMGIIGKMHPNVIRGIPNDSFNALGFIDEVIGNTLEFYEKIPQATIYKGVASECETFINNLNKYRYLFELCDVKNH